MTCACAAPSEGTPAPAKSYWDQVITRYPSAIAVRLDRGGVSPIEEGSIGPTARRATANRQQGRCPWHSRLSAACEEVSPRRLVHSCRLLAAPRGCCPDDVRRGCGPSQDARPTARGRSRHLESREIARVGRFVVADTCLYRDLPVAALGCLSAKPHDSPRFADLGISCAGAARALPQDARLPPSRARGSVLWRIHLADRR